MASSSPNKNTLFQSPPRLQDLNGPVISSPNAKVTHSPDEQVPSMEDTSKIGEFSVPISTFEESPSRMSLDSLMISSVLQDIHDQNLSLPKNKETSETVIAENVLGIIK